MGQGSILNKELEDRRHLLSADTVMAPDERGTGGIQQSLGGVLRHLQVRSCDILDGVHPFLWKLTSDRGSRRIGMMYFKEKYISADTISIHSNEM